MWQSISNFLRQRGFLILCIGFGITAVCMILYVYCINRHASILLRTIAFDATFAGIGIVAIGRIGVFLENSARRKAAKTPDITKKDSL